MAACFVMVACGGEQKQNPYVQAVEDLYDAVVAGDEAKIEKIVDKMENMDEPSDADQKALEKWAEKNPEKFVTVNAFMEAYEEAYEAYEDYGDYEDYEDYEDYDW